MFGEGDFFSSHGRVRLLSLLLLAYLHRSLELLSLTKDIFSLTELTDLTERYCAQFRTHRTPPAYRVHRALLPKVAVRFCEIGWLNVSVGLCVFCSSVYSVRNRTHPLYEITQKLIRWRKLLSHRVAHSSHLWVVLSRTEDISFSYEG